MTDVTTGMPLFRTELRLGKYNAAVSERLEQLDVQDFPERLWKKDHTLWKRDDAARRNIAASLGWLNVVEKMIPAVNGLVAFTNEIKAAGFTHALVMGMGGSSLAPLVMQNTFSPGGLIVNVLDTTDAGKIKEVEEGLPLETTLFIVASKSGTTAEPNAFLDYFYARMKEIKGQIAGENFIAITDPNTAMQETARKKNFRHTFLNYSDIGGRYSALSYFGMVPAALMGIDVKKLLGLAMDMVNACGPSVPVRSNPGLILGAAIGELAKQGRDKLTLFMPGEISTLGLWLEQLIAESTGKDDKGILPVCEDEIHEPGWYGDDRAFVYIDMPVTGSDKWRAQLDLLTEAGHPVIIVHMNSPYSLGQEFYRWEIATATAGSVIGVNPFDQPNVQESKDFTNRIIDKVRSLGHLPGSVPAVSEGPLSFYAAAQASEGKMLVKEFFQSVKPRNYIAILAYLTETSSNNRILADLRDQLQKRFRVPVTIGYGPRYLHSTGQYHKGGPNTGIFLQLTAKDMSDTTIPGRNFSFDVFRNAQALGDLEALQVHRRKVIRIDLGTDVNEGLAFFKQLLHTVLETGERSGVTATVAQ